MKKGKNGSRSLRKKEMRKIEEMTRQSNGRQPLPGSETGFDEYETEKNGKISADLPQVTPYEASLSNKEKYRFHRDTGQIRSFFGDVRFGYRSTIMDDLVQSTLTETSFKGAGWGKIKAEANKKDSQSNDGEDVSSVVFFNFSGFYVLFWMIVAFIVLRVGVDYYVTHDGDLWQSEILKFMTTDLISVALIDLVMYLCIYFVLFVHLAVKHEWISWKRTGRYLTYSYEIGFLLTFLYVAETVMQFHWVAKIFLFLHSLVLLMKMHSFASYNGYLWEILRELEFSKSALAKTKDAAIEDNFKRVLEKSCEFCQFELDLQSTKVKFPTNITVKSFFEYSMFPTLVYQVEYPRTEKIRWSYVFEKLCAIFGVILVMMIIAQFFMYPIALRAMAVRDIGMPIFWERILEWLYLLLKLVPSFIIMYLMVWYLIWDAILNCIAELTRFGDRYFYGDWWNCVSWDEFSRQWNVPVHKFLLRHVYHSSISFLHLNKMQATLMTFLLSSVVHELAMYVLFRKLRFYLFFLQMAQIPLVQLGNSKFLKSKKILGNAIFWLGICTGPSLMCTLYLTF
ncbi:LAME_0H14774g1_1 [Lachancea meyersii CBS 8951]|uniref:O-acyltransferase n=1 Tax=Lachancea meyersii CBS 8951 TaxID=1266667 RepID=A0A1G4KHP5_9SACH|nr:LAME_0H14774g1_1 [Lachancea meyersii CBS 8951]